ncbi:MAG: hypothetical protein ACE5ES_01240 [Candidatus Nanoarchaeia archaeon]
MLKEYLLLRITFPVIPLFKKTKPPSNAAIAKPAVDFGLLSFGVFFCIF